MKCKFSCCEVFDIFYLFEMILWNLNNIFFFVAANSLIGEAIPLEMEM